MTITEILDKVQYVTDTQGNRQGILIDLAAWEELIERLEDLEDEAELIRAKLEQGEIIPWEQAKEELRAQGIEV